MGILTLLRNAFGRSRKGRAAEAEGATTPSPEPQPTVPSPSPEPQPTATAQVPEPRVSTDTEPTDTDEHELVSAAFDNVTVPKQPEPTEQPVAEKPAEEPVAEEPTETPAAEEPTAAVEEPAATEAPVVEEPVVEEPVVEEPAATEAPVVEEPAAAETPVAEEPVAEAPAVEEPAAEEPAPDEPVAETPASDEPAVEESVAEEPTPEPEPEPVVEEPAPIAATEEPTPEPEASDPAPAETPEDTAAAADGEDAPQGPPAPDDESSTGGAGGNTKAEGEAEALPPTLRTAYTAAETVLQKQNLTTPAKLYLVLDRSASMRPYYKDGSAQALAEQTLALAAHLDPETTAPTVHVVFFSTELDGTGELTLTDHENKIDELHAALGRMGRTSYHVAVDEVVTHHQKNSPDTPALVIFQTDGAPDAKTPATHALTEAAKNHPSVFFSFVAFGEPDNKAFDYIRKLKTDNTSFFHAGPTPRELTDTELYEGVLATWRP